MPHIADFHDAIANARLLKAAGDVDDTTTRDAAIAGLMRMQRRAVRRSAAFCAPGSCCPRFPHALPTPLSLHYDVFSQPSCGYAIIPQLSGLSLGSSILTLCAFSIVLILGRARQDAAGPAIVAVCGDHRKRAGIGFLVFLPHSQAPPANEHQRDDDDDQHNDVSRGHGHTAKFPLTPDEVGQQ
jgi:hypothetical protein